jgi:hypothetical protein
MKQHVPNVKHVQSVVTGLLVTGAHKAFQVVGEKSVVRATRKLVAGRLPTRGNAEIVLTIGTPNFKERKFIKACKKAGEKLPLRKVQLRYAPKRKAGKR